MRKYPAGQHFCAVIVKICYRSSYSCFRSEMWNISNESVLKSKNHNVTEENSLCRKKNRRPVISAGKTARDLIFTNSPLSFLFSCNVKNKQKHDKANDIFKIAEQLMLNSITQQPFTNIWLQRGRIQVSTCQRGITPCVHYSSCSETTQ